MNINKNTFNKLFSSSSLKARLARGGMWMTIGGGADVGLKLIRNMVLARLIAPEAFGIMAIIIAVNSLFESFTQVGIKEAIIQSEYGYEKKYLNWAWWISLMRGAGLYLIGFLSAPFISDFYQIPELTFMLRIAFLSMIFAALFSPAAYSKLKEMDFLRWTMISLLGTVFGVASSVYLSFKISGEWALILGFILESLIRSVASFILCPYLPTFEMEKKYLDALLRFSRGMVGLPLLTFIFMRTDIFVIGKLCTQAELGIYSLAATLAGIPNVFMEKIITPLMIPAFSEIQNDNARVNKAIIRVSGLLALGGIPIIVFVYFNSGIILQIIYGEKYVPAALPFAVLFMSNLLRSISLPLVAVYFSKGKPELHRLFTAIRASLLIVLIYPAIKLWSYSGAAFAVCIAMLLAYIIQVQKLKNVTNLHIKDYYGVFLKAFIYTSPLIVWSLLSELFLADYIVPRTAVNIVGFMLVSIFIVKKYVLPMVMRINKGE